MQAAAHEQLDGSRRRGHAQANEFPRHQVQPRRGVSGASAVPGRRPAPHLAGSTFFFLRSSSLGAYFCSLVMMFVLCAWGPA
jgi:hypothetical protein